MQESATGRIHRVEPTSDTLTSRAGLAFFVQYLETIGVLQLLVHKFAQIKKSGKGVSIQNLFLQVLSFLLDGSSRALSSFDELRKDEGYRAVVQLPQKQMASSHAIKRFFRAFNIFHAAAFRWVLRELWVWRLRRDKPRQIILTLDTMVMDNDEAQKREGCDCTYKKVKGFQPLQLIWEGKIVEAIFRRGKRHSNYGQDVAKIIRSAVTLIRTRYDASVLIVLRVDAGFFDALNFAFFDELGIGFLATGKLFPAIEKLIAALAKDQWKFYANKKQAWSFARFSYQCERWSKAYSALYLRPHYKDQQGLLEFARPDNILLTNLVPGSPVWEQMSDELRQYWSQDESLIFQHHQRGADELPHRGFKEFGSEELPFQRFAANQAYYYLMVIGFFLFVTFKEDTLTDILPLSSYATTVRRKLIDLAGKVVRTSRAVILKVARVALESLQLERLWARCGQAAPIPLCP